MALRTTSWSSFSTDDSRDSDSAVGPFEPLFPIFCIGILLGICLCGGGCAWVRRRRSMNDPVPTPRYGLLNNPFTAEDVYLRESLMHNDQSVDSMEIGIYGRQKLNSSVFAPKTHDGLKRLLTQKTRELAGDIDEEEEDLLRMVTPSTEIHSNVTSGYHSEKRQRLSTHTLDGSTPGWSMMTTGKSVSELMPQVSVSNLASRGTSSSSVMVKS